MLKVHHKVKHIAFFLTGKAVKEPFQDMHPETFFLSPMQRTYPFQLVPITA